MLLRRFLMLGCLIAALLAFTSPFWYFSSDSSSHGTEHARATSELPEPPNAPLVSSDHPHNGRTGTIVLDLEGTLSAGASASANASANASAQPEATPEATTEDPPEAQPQAVGRATPASSDQDNADQASADPTADIVAHADSRTTGTITVKPKNQAPQNQTAERPRAAPKQPESSSQPAADNAAPAHNADNADNADSSDLNALNPSALTEEFLDQNAPAEGQPQPDANVTTAEADAQTTALEQTIAHLAAQQSAAAKQAYQEALAARKEQVNAAIATIAENSKQYYPPVMSQRAVVVFFSVPYEDKVRTDPKSRARLSQLLQQGAVGLPLLSALPDQKADQKAEQKSDETARPAPQEPSVPDALTGASTLYLLNDEGDLVPHQALRFIAATISAESGATLYEISPVTTYSQEIVTLYEQAWSEQQQGRYPELTDDTPLNLDDYDTIYLCYPNWWHDLPCALYSFFNKYDLSNKLVVPISLSAGEGDALRPSAFSMLEPNATLAPWGLQLSHADCASASQLSAKLRGFLHQMSTKLNPATP